MDEGDEAGGVEVLAAGAGVLPEGVAPGAGRRGRMDGGGGGNSRRVMKGGEDEVV